MSQMPPKSSIASAAGLTRRTITLPLIGSVSLGAVIVIGGIVYLLTRHKKQSYAVVKL